MNVRDGAKPPIWTSEGAEYRHPVALKGSSFPPERALNRPQGWESPQPAISTQLCYDFHVLLSSTAITGVIAVLLHTLTYIICIQLYSFNFRLRARS